ncbi:glycosyltransferase, partial [Rahnella sp. PD12R]|uniref:glycosyltransferase n=1 Tax=Rahnella sp. PD12R TaxID=2855688 RepID=UPI001C45F992
MIKILHCYKTYYPDTYGGVEQVIYQLAEGTIEHNVNSTVFSLTRKNLEGKNFVDNHQTYKVKTQFEVASTPFSFSAISKFKELAAKADIIHYHFPYPFMDIMHYAAKIKKPTILSYHADIVKQQLLSKVYNPLMKCFLNDVDCIVASSPNYARSSVVLSEFKHKTCVIPYGLEDKKYFDLDDERLAFWNSKFNDGFFIFVGAFRYYKGLLTLLKAARGAKYKIVLIGAGGIEVELKKYANLNELENVHFVGAVSDQDKYALLSLSRGVVFPSHLRSESFGISLLEGAIFSKPLISCEIGTGTTFINIDKETGIVIEPSNCDELKKAMDTLWNSPVLA